MIKQGMVNDSILEKKFKILRTSILLGNIKNREETIKSYEEAARDIDKIKRGMYEEILASKLYTTTTLEDEEARLKDLIKFIENRVNERNDFIDDYIKITSNFLDDLPKVSLESELPDYKNRLDNISEYLNNCKEINFQNDKLKKLRNDLEEKYENKANNEIINVKLEDELIEEFNKLIQKDEYYSSLNYLDIDNEIVKVDNLLKEKNDVMNTFVSSYEALTSAGISGAEREEYLSYVQDSRNDYYKEASKKYFLQIYKLVLDKETDYDKLYQKRLEIDNILKEREECRNKLNITGRDEFEYFINLCREQFSVIKSQKINIENIDKLIMEISECENRLDNLEKANNRPEIVELLNEFSVDNPKIEKIELPSEKEIQEEVITKEKEKEEVKPSNMVIKVREPVKINVKTASDTAKLVMKKVVIVLEPKKFNTKKDKLAEAEKEIESLKEKNDNFVDSNTDDIFLDNGLTINLDTKEVKNDSKVKDILTLDEVKINTKDDISIPTEIFVEDTPVEKPNSLFNDRDPFLDDNQFELDNVSGVDTLTGDGMPSVSGIGTVKPNSMLSKIENVTKENDDIILPTMGLVDNNSQDVPIVSENYIN